MRDNTGFGLIQVKIKLDQNCLALFQIGLNKSTSAPNKVKLCLKLIYIRPKLTGTYLDKTGFICDYLETKLNNTRLVLDLFRPTVP